MNTDEKQTYGFEEFSCVECLKSILPDLLTKHWAYDHLYETSSLYMTANTDVFGQHWVQDSLIMMLTTAIAEKVGGHILRIRPKL